MAGQASDFRTQAGASTCSLHRALEVILANRWISWLDTCSLRVASSETCAVACRSIRKLAFRPPLPCAAGPDHAPPTRPLPSLAPALLEYVVDLRHAREVLLLGDISRGAYLLASHLKHLPHSTTSLRCSALACAIPHEHHPGGFVQAAIHCAGDFKLPSSLENLELLRPRQARSVDGTGITAALLRSDLPSLRSLALPGWDLWGSEAADQAFSQALGSFSALQTLTIGCRGGEAGRADRVACSIAAAHSLTQLRQLQLVDAHVQCSGLPAASEAPLESLCLDGVRLCCDAQADVNGLAAWLAACPLRTLCLSHVNVGTVASPAIATALHALAPTLVELRLDCCYLPAAAVRGQLGIALAACRGLSSLSLQALPSDGDVLFPVIKRLPLLLSLDLSHSPSLLRGTKAARFCRCVAPHAAALHTLRLAGCGMSTQGMQVLSLALSQGPTLSLSCLDLRSNAIGSDDGATALMHLLARSSAWSEVSVEACGLQPVGVTKACLGLVAGGCNALGCLRLGSNPPASAFAQHLANPHMDAGAEALASAFEDAEIGASEVVEQARASDLFHLDVGPEGACSAALAAVCAAAPKLTSLHIGHNHAPAPMVSCVMAALEASGAAQHMSCLDLDECDVRDEHLQGMLPTDASGAWHSLQRLHIRGCSGTSSDSILALSKALPSVTVETNKVSKERLAAVALCDTPTGELG